MDFIKKPEAVLYFDNAQVVNLRVVCDIDSENDLIGIEILDLLFKCREQQVSIDTEGISTSAMLSYDSEVDALYIRIKPGDSVTQKSTDSSIQFSKDGRPLSITLHNFDQYSL